MVDLMAGPNAPLTKAFIFCGWRTITVDWLIDASHDLSHPLRQASLHEQLQPSSSQPWIAAPSHGPVRFQSPFPMAGRALHHSVPSNTRKASRTYPSGIRSELNNKACH